MAATDARPIPRKNTAFRAYFPIYDKTGSVVTGAAGLDSERSIDGAAFADCTNEATEVATSSGIYYLDLTASEMNGDAVVVIVKTTTTDARTTTLIFYPEEAGDLRADTTHIAGAAVATGTAQLGVNLVNIAGSAVSTSTAQLGVNAVQAGGTAWGSGAITAASVATGAIDADALAADAGTEIANAVWALDATGQQTQGSFGQTLGDSTTGGSLISRLPNATPGAAGGVFIAGSNAATSVSTSFTTTFTGNLTGSVASVTGAVGSVTGLNPSNLDATVSSRLPIASYTAPYAIRTGTAQAGAAAAITLDAGASATNQFYNGQLVLITGGTGAGQARVIVDYTGASKVADVFYSWAVTPDNTSTFVILPLDMRLNTSSIADGVWRQDLPSTFTSGQAGHTLYNNLDAAVTSRAASGSAMALSAAAVDAILDDVIEGTYTLRQMMRLVASALASKVSGAGTTTITFRDIGDTKNRIVASVDADGNRSSLTLDVT